MRAGRSLANPDSYGQPDCDCNRYANRDTDCYCNANSDSYAYLYTKTYANFNAKGDTDAENRTITQGSPYPGTAPVVRLNAWPGRPLSISLFVGIFTSVRSLVFG